MMIYDYTYYYIFELVSSLRKRNARESALLYLTLITYLLTAPFIIVSFYSTFKPSQSLTIAVILIYAGVVYSFNKKYFARAQKIRDISRKFKPESTLQKRIGYSVVIFLFLLSFVSFFFFLSIL